MSRWQTSDADVLVQCAGPWAPIVCHMSWPPGSQGDRAGGLVSLLFFGASCWVQSV